MIFSMWLFWIFVVTFGLMFLYSLFLFFTDDYDWEQWMLVSLFGLFITYMFFSIGKFIGWVIFSINLKELQPVGAVHFIGFIMLILLLRSNKERGE